LIVLIRPVVLLVCVVFAGTGVARAQGLAGGAQPPTKGALYRDGQSGRYLLGGTWLYRPDPGDVGVALGWWRDISATGGWSAVAVPSAYNSGDFSPASMQGSIGWYRRDFTLPSEAFARYVSIGARRWIVRFESINYRATVWLNGRLVGRHVGEDLPFEFDLADVRRGANRLIVRVDSRRLTTDLPPGPGSGWWNYGGILREVYLRAVQRADIAWVLVRPSLPCPHCAASIHEQVLVRNVTGGPATVQLRGLYGSVPLDFGVARIAPHATWTAEGVARIARPRLWSIDHPALYRATLRLSDELGRPLGGYVTYNGIRSITLKRGRVMLNGRLLSLRGVELREQDLRLGAALDPAHLGRLVSWVRALGATVIRSDALNPEIEEMADRYGILLWSDIPVTQQGNNQDPSQPAWAASALGLLRDNILSNGNHPSVFVWSIANELPTPATDADAAYIARGAALAHSLDPTRPVAMAVSDWPGLACDQAYAPLDAIGINEYFGWYNAGGGATDDRDALSPFLDSARACYPNKALFITEFGFDGSRNGPVEERGTYRFQADAAAYHLGVFASKQWLSGAIYFLLQDSISYVGYTGGNPWPDPPFNHKGLLDFQGNPKPAWKVVASIYRRTVQIAPPSRPVRRRRPVKH
jgi:beta-glucuronidase